MRLTKILILLIVLLLPGAASAQDAASEEAMNVMESIFNVSPSYIEGGDRFEYQHRYLGSLFGTFIYQIWDSGDPDVITPLAYAIGFVNIISMLLAVITFLYVYILGAVGTASDASLLGKDNSATMIPVRTAIGFGLLMPVPGIGGGVFSTIQLLIVWIIVTGSNAASVMWYKVVDYIVDNPEQVLGTGSVDRTAAYDIGKMLTCSFMVQKQLQERQQPAASRISLASFHYEGHQVKPGSQGMLVETSNKYFFFGKQNEYSMSSEPEYVNELRNSSLLEIQFSNGVCGKAAFPHISKTDDERQEDVKFGIAVNGARSISGQMMNSVHRVVADLINQYGDDFRNVREQYNSGGGGVGGDLAAYSERFRQIADTYGKSMDGLLALELYEDSGAASDLENKLKYGGWMNSILWFYERALYSSGKVTLTNDLNRGFKFGSGPNLCNDIDYSDDDQMEACGRDQEDLVLGLRTIDTFLVQSGFTDDAARRKISTACPFGPECGSTSHINSGQDLTDDSSRHFSATLLSLPYLAAGHDVSSTGGKLNPFTVISDLGHNINRNAIITWAAIGVVKSHTAAMADGIKHTQVPLLLKAAKIIGVYAATMLQNFAMFTVYSIGPMVLGIIANGFILAYVVPFMPVLTWIAMLIGYLMMVIEAVIAAPLAVVLMFTPEGRGIVGTRLQSAINLINACTLRPMLMTLGVLAGVQLSYVAYEILNTFFWQVASNYLHGSPIDYIAVLVVYVTACYQVCKLIVSAIPRLPDQIMSWMASGVGRAFGESEAMSNEASASHLSKGMGAGLQGGMQSGSVMRNSSGEKIGSSEKKDGSS